MLALVTAQNAGQEVGKQDGVIMEVQLDGFVFVFFCGHLVSAAHWGHLVSAAHWGLALHFPFISRPVVCVFLILVYDVIYSFSEITGCPQNRWFSYS